MREPHLDRTDQGRLASLLTSILFYRIIKLNQVSLEAQPHFFPTGLPHGYMYPKTYLQEALLWLQIHTKFFHPILARIALQ